jgi:phosphopantothenoylcysteine decarboxylase/phosphopantothenate--cysteine ligase
VLRNIKVVPFSTSASLREQLANTAQHRVDAVFHAAAVSDFSCKAVFRRNPEGQLEPLEDGKISTREGPVLAELVPTPKIIRQLRDLFPESWLVGWKYQVDEDQAAALRAGWDQVEECSTSACVVNGPAYGEGFGLAFPGDKSTHVEKAQDLFEELDRLIRG